MKKKIHYWKYFNIGEFLILVLGLFLDVFHKRIPRKIFLTKNILDALVRADAQIVSSKKELQVRLDGVNYLLRRPGSDLDVFNQIVIEGGVDRIVTLARNLNRPDIHIMDCGANIGLATLSFKKSFPQAKIIGLEPESGNYAQFEKNIALNGYADILPMQVGVWFEETVLMPNLDFRDGKNWSFALKEGMSTDGAGIPVLSPETIARQHQWNRIDVLKIDIEGSEFPLLRNVARWKGMFDTVSIISVEVHEELGSVFEIAELLWQQRFKLEAHGELIIGFRNVR